MNIRSIILVVGALFIAGITAMFARSLMSQPTTAQASAAPVQPDNLILVAAKPLPRGTILDPESVAWKPWPNDAVNETYIKGGPGQEKDVLGKVVRVSMLPGQPIPNPALVGPGERGFLAAVLAPGRRAVTVSVSDTSGVAGFVFPGDRVDLVLTHQVGDGGDRASLKVSETVLKNVRVLAIDQDTNDQENKPKVGRTVTLEVTPKLVEKISVMQLIGSVSLSLRSLAEEAPAASPTQVALAPPTPASAVAGSAAAPARPVHPANSDLPSDADPTFTLGSEVSRFANARPSRPASDAPPPPPPVTAAAPPKPAAPAGPRLTLARGNEVTQIAVGGR